MSSATGTVADLSGSSQRTDIPSEKITLTGKINLQDNTLSLNGIEVYFVKKENLNNDNDNINRVSSPVEYKYKALTNIEGIFSINNFECGIYDIFLLKQNYSSLDLIDIEISSQKNNYIEKTLTIPSKITGTVIMSDGSTKYGVKVFIGNKVYLTSQNGSFSANIPQGTYEIIIDEYGYERINRNIVVESNVNYNAGVFSLSRNFINPDLALLRGKVITSYGISVNNADVMLIGLEKTEIFNTNSTGNFDIPNIKAGVYILRIVNGYYSTDLEVELSQGKMTDVENIVVDNIKKNSIIEILFENLESIEQFKDITVLDTNLNSVDCIIKKEDNKYIIKGLKNGNFTLKLLSDYYDDIQLNLNSISGETIVREIIPIERKSVFSGSIKDTLGNGIKCSFRFNNETFTTDDNGDFTIDNLLAGNYSFYINCFGYKEFAESISIATGEDINSYSINLISNTSSGIYSQININFKVEKAVEYQHSIILYSMGNFYSFNKETNNIQTLIQSNRLITDFIVDSGAIYALDKANDEIVKYSLLNGDMKWNAAAGIEPFKILLANNELFVFSKGDRKIHIFEKDTGNFISQLPTGFDVMDAAVLGNSIFMADKYSNKLKIFDYINRLFGTEGSVTKPIKLYSYNDKLFVIKEGFTEVDVFNSSLVKSNTINSSLLPESISVGQNRIYSVSKSRITVYNKNSLSIEELENVMTDGMKSVIEDKNLANRLFIFEESLKRITVYYCK